MKNDSLESVDDDPSCSSLTTTNSSSVRTPGRPPLHDPKGVTFRTPRGQARAKHAIKPGTILNRLKEAMPGHTSFVKDFTVPSPSTSSDSNKIFFKTRLAGPKGTPLRFPCAAKKQQMQPEKSYFLYKDLIEGKSPASGRYGRLFHSAVSDLGGPSPTAITRTQLSPSETKVNKR